MPINLAQYLEKKTESFDITADDEIKVAALMKHYNIKNKSLLYRSLIWAAYDDNLLNKQEKRNYGRINRRISAGPITPGNPPDSPGID